MKLFESEKTLAFLDIQPLSRGHAVHVSSPPLPLIRVLTEAACDSQASRC